MTCLEIKLLTRITPRIAVHIATSFLPKLPLSTLHYLHYKATIHQLLGQDAPHTKAVQQTVRLQCEPESSRFAI